VTLAVAETGRVPVVPATVSVEVEVPGAFGQYCRLIPQLWPGANDALEQVFAGMLKMPLLDVSETKLTVWPPLLVTVTVMIGMLGPLRLASGWVP
jgi:hypothetical protein